MKFILLFLLSTLSTNIVAQNKLNFHTESVDSLLVWMQEGCNKNKIDNLVLQPATQLMEQLLRNKEKRDVPTFQQALLEFNYNDSISENIYILNDAYKRRLEIEELANEIKKREFSKYVYNRVLKYFPDNYIPPRDYDVFFTTVGWKWGDAMQFKYNVKDGKYLLSDEEGTPAFMFNLALVCMTYGYNSTEQILAMDNVMSHELFHAVFSDYTDSNWLLWNNEDINNYTLFLMLDEGIGHYISDGQLLQNEYNKNGNLIQKENHAFSSFSENAKDLFNTENDEKKRINSLILGTYGNYWEKFICITGMFMIYHIEQYYGIDGIKECIKNGPIYFVEKYKSIQKINAQLPELPKEILKFIELNNE